MMAKAKVRHRVVLYITPDERSRPMTEKQMTKEFNQGAITIIGGIITCRNAVGTYGTVDVGDVMNEEKKT